MKAQTNEAHKPLVTVIFDGADAVFNKDRLAAISGRDRQPLDAEIEMIIGPSLPGRFAHGTSSCAERALRNGLP